VLLQAPSQEGQQPFDSDFAIEQDELTRLPRSASELARIRLNLAASAFELCHTLELEDASVVEVGRKLYEGASDKYQELEDIRTSLDGITASSLGIDSPVWSGVQPEEPILEEPAPVVIVHEPAHAFISPDIVERLRKGQGPVIESLLQYLGSHEPSETRGQVPAPTGAGKTVIFTHLLEMLRRNGQLPRTYVGEPTIQLRDQTYK
jgi:hypothetical protein